MSRLSLELIPSKPLSLSNHALETLSKTFEKHRATILKKSSNKTLELKFSFPESAESMRQEIDETKQEIEKIRESTRPTKEDEVRVLKTIIKGYRAQVNALSHNFLVRIAENQVSIKTNTKPKISELSFIWFNIIFRAIISHICEAYGEMGERVAFREKHRGLLEKLPNAQDEDEYYS